MTIDGDSERVDFPRKRELNDGEKKLLATLDSLFLLDHLKSDTISSLMDIHSMLCEIDWNGLMHQSALPSKSSLGPVGLRTSAGRVGGGGGDDSTSLLSKTSAIDSGLGRASAATSASQNVDHIYSNIPPAPSIPLPSVPQVPSNSRYSGPSSSSGERMINISLARPESSSMSKTTDYSPPPSSPSTAMSFLSPFFQSPSSSPTPPVSYDSTHSLAMQVITSLTPEWISEAQELCHLLSNPHLKLLFKISDIVASKDFNNSFLYSFPFKPIVNQIDSCTHEMTTDSRQRSSILDKHTYCNVSLASSNRSHGNREYASSIGQSILLPSSSTSSMLHNFTGEQDVTDENYHHSVDNIMHMDDEKEHDQVNEGEEEEQQQHNQVIKSTVESTTVDSINGSGRRNICTSDERIDQLTQSCSQHPVSIKNTSMPLHMKEAIVTSTSSVNNARGASTNVQGASNADTLSPVREAHEGGVRAKSIILHHKDKVNVSSPHDTSHVHRKNSHHHHHNFFKLPCIPRPACMKSHIREETTSPVQHSSLQGDKCNPIYQSIGSHIHATPTHVTDTGGKSSRNTYHHYSVIDSNDENYYSNYDWDYYDVAGRCVRPTKVVCINKGLEPLGITFSIMDGKKCHHVIVSRVIYDGPVYRSGEISPGDLIIEVNSINLKCRSHRAIVHILERESNRDCVTFKLICASVDSATRSSDQAIYSKLIGPTCSPVTVMSDTCSPSHEINRAAERKKLLVTLDMVDRITSGRSGESNQQVICSTDANDAVKSSCLVDDDEIKKSREPDASTSSAVTCTTSDSSYALGACELVTHGPNVYVKAHFDYNPWLDRSHPCPEIGLVFKKGAILQIVNQTDDTDWWQARHEDSLGYTCRVGIIPSATYYESRIAIVRDAKRLRRLNEKLKLCSGFKSPIKRSTWSKKVKKIMYKSTHMEDFEESDIPTYEEVIHLYPSPGFSRPIIFFGSSFVGIGKMLRRLKQTDPFTYVSPVAHTTRSPRLDTSVTDDTNCNEYLYISREQFVTELISGAFIEWDEYNGHLYGIHRETVRSIIASGCVCVMTLQASGLKSVRNSLFKPYVIFFKPDTSAVVQAETDEIISFYGSSVTCNNETNESHMSVGGASNQDTLQTILPDTRFTVNSNEFTCNHDDEGQVATSFSNSGATGVQKKPTISTQVTDDSNNDDKYQYHYVNELYDHAAKCNNILPQDSCVNTYQSSRVNDCNNPTNESSKLSGVKNNGQIHVDVSTAGNSITVNGIMKSSPCLLVGDKYTGKRCNNQSRVNDDDTSRHLTSTHQQSQSTSCANYSPSQSQGVTSNYRQLSNNRATVYSNYSSATSKRSKFKRNHFRNLDCNQRRQLLLESAQLEYLYSHYFDTIMVIGDDFQDVLLQTISTIRDVQVSPQWAPASWL